MKRETIPHTAMLAPSDVRAVMLADNLILNYLPTNQAYMVTFCSIDGPRLFGPAPLAEAWDWYEEHYLV